MASRPRPYQREAEPRDLFSLAPLPWLDESATSDENAKLGQQPTSFRSWMSMVTKSGGPTSSSTASLPSSYHPHMSRSVESSQQMPQRKQEGNNEASEDDEEVFILQSNKVSVTRLKKPIVSGDSPTIATTRSPMDRSVIEEKRAKYLAQQQKAKLHSAVKDLPLDMRYALGASTVGELAETLRSGFRPSMEPQNETGRQPGSRRESTNEADTSEITSTPSTSTPRYDPVQVEAAATFGYPLSQATKLRRMNRLSSVISTVSKVESMGHEAFKAETSRRRTTTTHLPRFPRPNSARLLRVTRAQRPSTSPSTPSPSSLSPSPFIHPSTSSHTTSTTSPAAPFTTPSTSTSPPQSLSLESSVDNPSRTIEGLSSILASLDEQAVLKGIRSTTGPFRLPPDMADDLLISNGNNGGRGVGKMAMGHTILGTHRSGEEHSVARDSRLKKKDYTMRFVEPIRISAATTTMPSIESKGAPASDRTLLSSSQSKRSITKDDIYATRPSEAALRKLVHPTLGTPGGYVHASLATLTANDILHLDKHSAKQLAHRVIGQQLEGAMFHRREKTYNLSATPGDLDMLFQSGVTGPDAGVFVRAWNELGIVFQSANTLLSAIRRVKAELYRMMSGRIGAALIPPSMAELFRCLPSLTRMSSETSSGTVEAVDLPRRERFDHDHITELLRRTNSGPHAVDYIRRLWLEGLSFPTFESLLLAVRARHAQTLDTHRDILRYLKHTDTTKATLLENDDTTLSLPPHGHGEPVAASHPPALVHLPPCTLLPPTLSTRLTMTHMYTLTGPDILRLPPKIQHRINNQADGSNGDNNRDGPESISSTHSHDPMITKITEEDVSLDETLESLYSSLNPGATAAGDYTITHLWAIASAGGTLAADFLTSLRSKRLVKPLVDEVIATIAKAVRIRHRACCVPFDGARYVLPQSSWRDHSGNTLTPSAQIQLPDRPLSSMGRNTFYEALSTSDPLLKDAIAGRTADDDDGTMRLPVHIGGKPRSPEDMFFSGDDVDANVPTYEHPPIWPDIFLVGEHSLLLPDQQPLAYSIDPSSSSSTTTATPPPSSPSDDKIGWGLNPSSQSTALVHRIYVDGGLISPSPRQTPTSTAISLAEAALSSLSQEHEESEQGQTPSTTSNTDPNTPTHALNASMSTSTALPSETQDPGTVCPLPLFSRPFPSCAPECSTWSTALSTAVIRSAACGHALTLAELDALVGDAGGSSILLTWYLRDIWRERHTRHPITGELLGLKRLTFSDLRHEIHQRHTIFSRRIATTQQHLNSKECLLFSNRGPGIIEEELQVYHSSKSWLPAVERHTVRVPRRGKCRYISEEDAVSLYLQSGLGSVPLNSSNTEPPSSSSSSSSDAMIRHLQFLATLGHRFTSISQLASRVAECHSQEVTSKASLAHILRLASHRTAPFHAPLLPVCPLCQGQGVVEITENAMANENPATESRSTSASASAPASFSSSSSSNASLSPSRIYLVPCRGPYSPVDIDVFYHASQAGGSTVAWLKLILAVAKEVRMAQKTNDGPANDNCLSIPSLPALASIIKHLQRHDISTLESIWVKLRPHLLRTNFISVVSPSLPSKDKVKRLIVDLCRGVSSSGLPKSSSTLPFTTQQQDGQTVDTTSSAHPPASLISAECRAMCDDLCVLPRLAARLLYTLLDDGFSCGHFGRVITALRIKQSQISNHLSEATSMVRSLYESSLSAMYRHHLTLWQSMSKIPNGQQDSTHLSSDHSSNATTTGSETTHLTVEDGITSMFKFEPGSISLCGIGEDNTRATRILANEFIDEDITLDLMLETGVGAKLVEYLTELRGRGVITPSELVKVAYEIDTSTGEQKPFFTLTLNKLFEALPVWHKASLARYKKDESRITAYLQSLRGTILPRRPHRSPVTSAVLSSGLFAGWWNDRHDLALHDLTILAERGGFGCFSHPSASSASAHLTTSSHKSPSSESGPPARRSPMPRSLLSDGLSHLSDAGDAAIWNTHGLFDLTSLGQSRSVQTLSGLSWGSSAPYEGGDVVDAMNIAAQVRFGLRRLRFILRMALGNPVALLPFETAHLRTCSVSSSSSLQLSSSSEQHVDDDGAVSSSVPLTNPFPSLTQTLTRGEAAFDDPYLLEGIASISAAKVRSGSDGPTDVYAQGIPPRHMLGSALSWLIGDASAIPGTRPIFVCPGGHAEYDAQARDYYSKCDLATLQYRESRLHPSLLTLTSTLSSLTSIDAQLHVLPNASSISLEYYNELVKSAIVAAEVITSTHRNQLTALGSASVHGSSSASIQNKTTMNPSFLSKPSPANPSHFSAPTPSTSIPCPPPLSYIIPTIFARPLISPQLAQYFYVSFAFSGRKRHRRLPRVPPYAMRQGVRGWYAGIPHGITYPRRPPCATLARVAKSLGMSTKKIKQMESAHNHRVPTSRRFNLSKVLLKLRRDEQRFLVRAKPIQPPRMSAEFNPDDELRRFTLTLQHRRTAASFVSYRRLSNIYHSIISQDSFHPLSLIHANAKDQQGNTIFHTCGQGCGWLKGVYHNRRLWLPPFESIVGCGSRRLIANPAPYSRTRRGMRDGVLAGMTEAHAVKHGLPVTSVLQSPYMLLGSSKEEPSAALQSLVPLLECAVKRGDPWAWSLRPGFPIWGPLVNALPTSTPVSNGQRDVSGDDSNQHDQTAPTSVTSQRTSAELESRLETFIASLIDATTAHSNSESSTRPNKQRELTTNPQYRQAIARLLTSRSFDDAVIARNEWNQLMLASKSPMPSASQPLSSHHNPFAIALPWRLPSILSTPMHRAPHITPTSFVTTLTLQGVELQRAMEYMTELRLLGDPYPGEPLLLDAIITRHSWRRSIAERVLLLSNDGVFVWDEDFGPLTGPALPSPVLPADKPERSISSSSVTGRRHCIVEKLEHPLLHHQRAVTSFTHKSDELVSALGAYTHVTNHPLSSSTAISSVQSNTLPLSPRGSRSPTSPHGGTMPSTSDIEAHAATSLFTLTIPRGRSEVALRTHSTLLTDPSTTVATRQSKQDLPLEDKSIPRTYSIPVRLPVTVSDIDADMLIRRSLAGPFVLPHLLSLSRKGYSFATSPALANAVRRIHIQWVSSRSALKALFSFPERYGCSLLTSRGGFSRATSALNALCSLPYGTDLTLPSVALDMNDEGRTFHTWDELAKEMSQMVSQGREALMSFLTQSLPGIIRSPNLPNDSDHDSKPPSHAGQSPPHILPRSSPDLQQPGNSSPASTAPPTLGPSFSLPPNAKSSPPGDSGYDDATHGVQLSVYRTNTADFSELSGQGSTARSMSPVSAHVIEPQVPTMSLHPTISYLNALVDALLLPQKVWQAVTPPHCITPPEVVITTPLSATLRPDATSRRGSNHVRSPSSHQHQQYHHQPSVSHPLTTPHPATTSPGYPPPSPAYTPISPTMSRVSSNGTQRPGARVGPSSASSIQLERRGTALSSTELVPVVDISSYANTKEADTIALAASYVLSEDAEDVVYNDDIITSDEPDKCVMRSVPYMHSPFALPFDINSSGSSHGDIQWDPDSTLCVEQIPFLEAIDASPLEDTAADVCSPATILRILRSILRQGTTFRSVTELITTVRSIRAAELAVVESVAEWLQDKGPNILLGPKYKYIRQVKDDRDRSMIARAHVGNAQFRLIADADQVLQVQSELLENGLSPYAPDDTRLRKGVHLNERKDEVEFTSIPTVFADENMLHHMSSSPGPSLGPDDRLASPTPQRMSNESQFNASSLINWSQAQGLTQQRLKYIETRLFTRQLLPSVIADARFLVKCGGTGLKTLESLQVRLRSQAFT